MLSNQPQRVLFWIPIFYEAYLHLKSDI